jgi:N-acyl-D-aspartate/D-glutamate deacylase
LPQVVRQLSGATAETVQLFDRGKLVPGFKADVNVIDLDALTLHGPVIRYDLPGNGRRLDQEATGYVATICNGQVIRRNDKPTDARPGRVIRGARALAAE